MGICPSTQVFPPSTETKKPVGTRAWMVEPVKEMK
jgi:hypothetical protein